MASFYLPLSLSRYDQHIVSTNEIRVHDGLLIPRSPTRPRSPGCLLRGSCPCDVIIAICDVMRAIPETPRAPAVYVTGLMTPSAPAM